MLAVLGVCYTSRSSEQDKSCITNPITSLSSYVILKYSLLSNLSQNSIQWLQAKLVLFHLQISSPKERLLQLRSISAANPEEPPYRVASSSAEQPLHSYGRFTFFKILFGSINLQCKKCVTDIAEEQTVRWDVLVWGLSELLLFIISSIWPVKCLPWIKWRSMTLQNELGAEFSVV